MPPDERYRDLVARLDRRHAELAAERAQVTAWYEQQRAAAESAVRRAGAAVAQATAEVDQARSTVERTDLEAHRLWRLLEDRIGPLGQPPPPATVVVDDDPADLLQAVEGRLERHRRAPRETPSWVSPLLVVSGVLGAGIGYAAAHGARWAALRIGGDFAVFAPVLKQIVTLLAPLAGLVPAKLLADRRHTRLDGGAVGVVLISGLLALGALLVVMGW